MAMKLNKDGTARWDKGDVLEVEVNSEEHDPNSYFALCMTTGTYPTLQVFDDKYPEPLEGREVDPPYTIWRLLPDDEAKRVKGHDPTVVDGVTYGIHFEPGQVYVYDKRKRKKHPVEHFSLLEDAQAWIADNECELCGRPTLEKAKKGCPGQHFTVEDDLDLPTAF
jgi:hypothetical protein